MLLLLLFSFFKNKLNMHHFLTFFVHAKGIYAIFFFLLSFFLSFYYQKTPHKSVSTMQRAREAFKMCDEKDTFWFETPTDDRHLEKHVDKCRGFGILWVNATGIVWIVFRLKGPLIGHFCAPTSVSFPTCRFLKNKHNKACQPVACEAEKNATLPAVAFLSLHFCLHL